MPSLDRRLKKIETMCHCEITIDSVNKKTSRKLLDVYHLIEVYYDEVYGNHEGCLRMFNELLKDYGNMQTVITVTKSKDGRIYKRNHMSDSTFYQLVQNSKLYSLDTVEIEKEIIPVKKKPSVSSKLISKDSVKLSNDIIIAEIIEENVSNTVRSYEIEQFTKDRSDDQLFHHIALSRSMTNDLKQVKVLDRRSSKILTTFEIKPEIFPAIIQNDISDFNLFATPNLEIDDEYVSAISSLSSVVSSSSTTFDDAESQSSIEDAQQIENKCASFFNTADQFGFEHIPNKNFINMVIDDICRECFFEQSKVIKILLLNHIRNIQFVTLQYLECLVEEVMETVIMNLSIYYFSEESDLWNHVIESFVKIVNHSLWDVIRKSCQEAVSEDTEYITMENLIKEIMSSGMCSTSYEIDSIDGNNEYLPRFKSSNSTYESFNTGRGSNFKNIEIIINQSNNNNSLSIHAISHKEGRKPHIISRIQHQTPRAKRSHVSMVYSQVKTVINQKIVYPLIFNINQNINNKMKKNSKPSSSTDNTVVKPTKTTAIKSVFKMKMIILYKDVSETLANAIESHVKLTSISIISNEFKQSIIQNAISFDENCGVNYLSKYEFQKILNNQVEDLCFQNFSLDFNDMKMSSLVLKTLLKETSLEYCQNSPKPLKEMFVLEDVYFVDVYTCLQETVNLSIAISCNQTGFVQKADKRSSRNVYSKPRMHEIVYWVKLEHVLNLHRVLVDEVVDTDTKKEVINWFKKNSMWYQICHFDRSFAVNVVNEILYLISFDDLVYKDIFPNLRCRLYQLQFYKYILASSLKMEKEQTKISKFMNSRAAANVNLELAYKTEQIRTRLPKSEINEIRISNYDMIKNQNLFNRITSSSDSESFFSAKEIENFDRQSFENRLREMKTEVTVTYKNQSNHDNMNETMTNLWFESKYIFNNVRSKNCSNSFSKCKRTGSFSVLENKTKILLSNVEAKRLFKLNENIFENKRSLHSYLLKSTTQNSNNISNDPYFDFNSVNVIKELYFSNISFQKHVQKPFYGTLEIWKPPAMKFQNIRNHIHYYIYEMNLPFLEETSKEMFITNPPLLTSLFKKITNPENFTCKYKNSIKVSKSQLPDYNVEVYLTSKADDFITCNDLSSSESLSDYLTVQATESINQIPLKKFDFDYFSAVLRRFLKTRKKSKGESQIKTKKNLNQNSTNILANLKLENYPFAQMNIGSLKLLADNQKQALCICLSKLFDIESVNTVYLDLKLKLQPENIENNMIKCSTLSTIVSENMEMILKQIIDIKFKMELAKKSRIRSKLVYALSSTFSKIYNSEAESIQFYKNGNIVLNIIYESIGVDLKSISSLCCISLDVEKILKRTYGRIYRQMLSDLFKTNVAVRVSIE